MLIFASIAALAISQLLILALVYYTIREYKKAGDEITGVEDLFYKTVEQITYRAKVAYDTMVWNIKSSAIYKALCPKQYYEYKDSILYIRLNPALIRVKRRIRPMGAAETEEAIRRWASRAL